MEKSEVKPGDIISSHDGSEIWLILEKNINNDLFTVLKLKGGYYINTVHKNFAVFSSDRFLNKL